MHPTTTPKNNTSQPKLIWWFVVVCLASDVALFPLLDWLDGGGIDEEIFRLLCAAGAIVGQCCFVVVISALARRTWFGGFLLGLFIATAGFFAVTAGSWLSDELEPKVFVGVTAVPAFLLISATPLFVFRHQFGWRIAGRDQVVPPRQPLNLAGMFSLMAVVAAALVMWRAPQIVLEEDVDDYWIPMLIMSAIAFAIGLIIVPVCVRIGLGRRAAVLGLLAIAVAIAIVSFGISQCFYSLDERWAERIAIVPYLFGFVGSALAVFYASLFVIRVSGLSLRRQATTKGPVSESGQSDLQHRRRDTRWRIASAVAVTMLVSAYLAHLQSWRTAKDEENARLREVAELTGGGISFRDRYAKKLTLGEATTDEDFAKFIGCSRLEYLYIRSPDITDAGLTNLQHLRELATLALAGTKVTNEGLEHLQHLPHLTSLTIQDTPVNGSGIVHLTNKDALHTLSLFGSGFGDEQVGLLKQFPNVRTLFLDRTKITDAGLPGLLSLKELTHLQLTETQVTAESFPRFASLNWLYLDGSRTEDTGIESVAQLPALTKLSVRDTRITNAATAHIRHMPSLQVLEASNTQIDDEGLSELRHALKLSTLDLSDSSITGEGFRMWNSSRLTRLWLDRTALDDEGVKNLVKLAPFRELSLEDTSITDLCLPALAQIGVDALNVSGSQLTAKGIMKQTLPSVTQITLGEEQLKSSERYDYQKKLGVGVSVKTPGSDEQ